MNVIQNTPDLIQPVYNPIFFQNTSNLTSNEGFKFVYDLYVNDVYVNRDKLPPRPTNDCVYSPARILESYLTYDKYQNLVGVTGSTNSILKYQINSYEEYLKRWCFDTITRDSLSGTSATVLSSATLTHSYSVGDNITIDNTVDTTYNGQYTITRIDNSYSVVLDASIRTLSNVVYNASFIDDSIWLTNSNWNISGDTAVCVNSNLGALEQDDILTSGQTYEVQIKCNYLNTAVTVNLGTSSYNVTSTGVTIFSLSANSTDLKIYPLSGQSATIDYIYIRDITNLSGCTYYTDKRRTIDSATTTNILFNPSLQYSLGGWTSYGADGCAVTAGLVVTNKLQLTVPDASCNTFDQKIYNTGTTLIAGALYDVTYTVSNVNNPSGGDQFVRPIVGGTYGSSFTGTGTTTERILAGTGTTFGVQMYMDADTGGYGSHSMAISAISVKPVTQFSGYTFNGVIQYEDVPTWYYTSYMMTGTSSSFLTNQPSSVKTKLDERGSIGWMNTQPYVSGTSYYMMIERSNASTIYYPISYMSASSVSTNNKILSFGAYPYNLNELSANTITDSTSYYDLTLVKSISAGTYSAISETKRFEVDTECSKYEPIRFMFLNQLGQFDYYTATLLSRENININRTQYQKTLPFNYNVGDRGKAVISIEGQQSYTVTSNWINETTYEWLIELFLSPEVYVINTDGSLTPIIIDNTSVENKKRVNDSLLNYTFNFTKAVMKNTQRG